MERLLITTVYSPKQHVILFKFQSFLGGRTADAMIDAVLAQVSKAVKSRLNGGGSSGGSSSGSDDSSAGFEAKAVVQLTDVNFEKTVMNSDDLWVVAFHAPWCGHCKFFLSFTLSLPYTYFQANDLPRNGLKLLKN